jgi:hypothetical protein
MICPRHTLLSLWDTFWGKSATRCFVETAIDIPDPRTLNVSNRDTKFTYLKFPGDSKSPCGLRRIPITETYTSLYAALCMEDSRWQDLAGKSQLGLHITFYCYHRSTWYRYVHGYFSSSLVLNILFRPLLGKTTSLSYILVRRLQDQKAAIYCNRKNVAYVFTTAGVQKVTWKGDEPIEVLDGPTASFCALVNIHPGLVEVPQPFHPSPFRLGRVVVTSSPNPAHVMAFHAKTFNLPTWEWVRNEIL